MISAEKIARMLNQDLDVDGRLIPAIVVLGWYANEHLHVRKRDRLIAFPNGHVIGEC